MLKHVLKTSVLLVSLPLLAQGGPGPGDHGPMGFGGFGMRAPVTNAPYTAVYTTTSTEKLQDGTVLTHTSTRTVERDSLGRVREDTTMAAHGDSSRTQTMTVIMDPVARTVTQLHADNKTATVRTLPQPGQFGGRGNHSGVPAADATATPSAPHARKNETETDLGSKTISGVVATGKRITHTIPAGEMGNTTPLVSTREMWFSPDLKIEVGNTESDPFRGTRTTTVTSLSKTEPEASLFAVPSGYTVQQAPQRAFGHRGPGGPGGDHAPVPPPPGA